jgi:uncharacterized OB-fold protein
MTDLLGEELATELTRPYWDGLHEGELTLQRCQACGRWQHYPRRLCRWCWSTELTFAGASGRGTVIAVALSHRTPKQGLRERLPMSLGLVALAEGPVLMACVDGESRAGQAVVHDPAQTLRSGLLSFAACTEPDR